MELPRTPTRVRLAQSNDLLRHLRRCFERRRPRTPRLVDQTLDAALFKAADPLVRGLSADAVLPRQLRDGSLLGQDSQDELSLDVHDRPLGPRHPVEDAGKGRPCHLCPDNDLVTYVLSLNRPQTSGKGRLKVT